MSYDFTVNHTIKKTRKAHTCMWCGGQIDAGSTAVRIAGTTEGDFWNGRLHLECHAAANEVCKRYGECHFDRDYARGRMDDDRTKQPEFTADGKKVAS